MGAVRRARLRIPLLLLALLPFAGVYLGQWFLHDGGCVVETHCAACVSGLGTQGAEPPAAPALPSPARAEAVEAADVRVADVVFSVPLPSRGPPLA
jgi:hypothetical protein